MGRRSWSDAHVKAVRDGAADKLSMGDVARLIGKSRNSVASKAHQLGVVFNSQPELTQRLRAPRVAKPQPKPVVAVPEPASPPESSLGVTIEALGDRMCRWPDPGEGRALTYCGHQTEGPRRPYCAAHARAQRSAVQPTWKP